MSLASIDVAVVAPLLRKDVVDIDAVANIGMEIDRVASAEVATAPLHL